MKIRIGFGFDVHQLTAGRDLWIGGIKIDHTLGLLGHSDADVLIHAICDAILGAANMRDIGYHFPPKKGNEFENIDSKILLKKTLDIVAEKGYAIGNIDCTICAERPKLNPHIPQMQETLANVMGIDIDDISIKATTTRNSASQAAKKASAPTLWCCWRSTKAHLFTNKGRIIPNYRGSPSHFFAAGFFCLVNSTIPTESP